MPRTMQPSFAGGEVGPDVYARVDLAKYSVSARKLLNYFVHPHGGASNRAGLEFCVETKHHAKRSRVIDFEAETRDTYTLEFGDRYMRVLRNGARVLFPEDFEEGAAAADTTADLSAGSGFTIFDLSFRVRNDVPVSSFLIYSESAQTFKVKVAARLAAGEFTVMDEFSLTHTGTGWEAVAVTYTPPEYGELYLGAWVDNAAVDVFASAGRASKAGDISPGVPTSSVTEDNGPVIPLRVMYDAAGTIYQIPTPWLEEDLRLLKYEQSNDVLTVTHASYPIYELSRYDHHDWRLTTIDFQPRTPTPTGLFVSATIASTTGWTPTSHQYKVTAVDEDTGEESLPTAASGAVTNDVAINRGNFNILSWSAVAGASEYNVYKGRNGIYGFVGRTVDTVFKEDNIAPDFTNTPPKGENPFNGENKYPRTVSFHQQRRVFGGSNTRPQNVWLTRTGNFKNMGVSSPAKDDDAITFGIAARSKQIINHIVALEDMLVFTPSTEWKVTGPDGGAITPTSIALKPQSYYGSNDVRPIVSGDQVLFVQTEGSIVRDISFVFERNKYVSNDLTILSPHLFRSKQVVDWSYAQVPSSQIHALQDDGSWLAMTYMREHEVWAWSPQATRGYVESTCAVAEGGENVAYFVVRRYINGEWKRFIERLHTRQFLNVKDGFFVDSGLSLDTGFVCESMTQAEEAVFTYTAHGINDGDTVEVETNTGPNGERIEGRAVVNVLSADTFTLTMEGEDDPIDTSEWSIFDLVCTVRILVDQIAGLDHLEGERVVGLADGNVIGIEEELIVTDGEITLPNAAGRVHLGLQYIADFESLDLSTGQDVVQGVIKSVGPVQVHVMNTRGIQIGSKFGDAMYEPKYYDEEGVEIDVYSSPTAMVTGILETSVEPEWNEGGRLCVRQSYPLPVTLLATIPNVEIGG
jgi:hypothetical protein